MVISRPSSGCRAYIKAAPQRAPVGVENAIEHATVRFARRFQQQGLIEADSRVPVRQRTQFVRIDGMTRRLRGIEHQEIVAQTLHLQEIEAHGRGAYTFAARQSFC
jgi:hypothetical protein